METDLFTDRTEAGNELARRLEGAVGNVHDLLVLGLPRGGVPVAYAVAKRLRAQLDVFLAGKLGFPGQPELALGAVTAQGIRFLNPDIAAQAGLSAGEIDELARNKRVVLERKEALYRQGGPEPLIEGRTVVLVDDGAATGASMLAALKALRMQQPRALLAAVPVASRHALEALAAEADEVVCLRSPQQFLSVGEWYEDFGQVADEIVIGCLEAAKAWHWSPIPDRKTAGAAADPGLHALRIHCGEARLDADLAVPKDAAGLVIFAHGSGSGRRSPRNGRVARMLNEAGFATLLLDLLSEEEARRDERTGEFRFDVDLLAGRLDCATRWMEADPRVLDLPVGYYGASTGAAAALLAAARFPDKIAAVVSRGGRPDLARERLRDVKAPCLLIVGGEDEEVLELNRQALESLRTEKRLAVIPGATHLFEEPGTLEQAGALAAGWYAAHLAKVAESAGA